MSAPKANTETLRLKSKGDIIIAPKQYMGRKDISMVIIDTPKLCYINESAFKDMVNLFSVQINAKGIVLCSESFANDENLQTLSIKSIHEDLFVDDKALSNLKSLRSGSLIADIAWLAPYAFANKPKKNCFIKLSCTACISGNKNCDMGLAYFVPIVLNFDENSCLFPKASEFDDEKMKIISPRQNTKRQTFDNIGKINSRTVISKFFDTITNGTQITETATANETIVKR